jgi:DNA-binding NarL/FixJ family response regulator
VSGLQILIADDHPVVRRSIRLLLESHGWSVREASSGREAIDQTRRLHPDVVVLDMSMPEIDGLRATRDILKDDPDALVLILTMHSSDALAVEAERAGAKGVIAKSFAPETLIATIESLSRTIVHLAGSVVGRLRHIAAFFRTTEERYRVLAPFVEEGFDRGEKALHILDPPDRETHAAWLRRSGVDLGKAEAEGRARLIPWSEAISWRCLH